MPRAIDLDGDGLHIRFDYPELFRVAIENRDSDWLESLLIVAETNCINQEDADGLTPLMRAVKVGYAEGVELLLRYGADVNQPNRQGFSALFYALCIGQDKIELIITTVRDPETLDAETTVVEQAQPPEQFETCVQICQLLIEKGAYLNQKDAKGQTVLMHAIWKGHSPMVRFLVDKGAGLKIKDNDGQTALAHAKEAGYPDMVAFLEAADQLLN